MDVNIKAAIKFEKMNKAIIEIIDVIRPKISAYFFVIIPEGIGLKQVLSIRASKSDSYHILRVPAAPAPNATAKSEIIELTKLICVGAIKRPTTQVKITRDITLGFIN